MCLVAAKCGSASVKEHLNANLKSFPSEDFENMFILVEVSSADRDEVGEGVYLWVYLLASSSIAEQLLL